jgi:hypothetical protein
MPMSKCPRCSKPITQALATCMGCGKDLRSSPFALLAGFAMLIAACGGVLYVAGPMFF